MDLKIKLCSTGKIKFVIATLWISEWKIFVMKFRQNSLKIIVEYKTENSKLILNTSCSFCLDVVLTISSELCNSELESESCFGCKTQL